ncbi:MAG: DUF1565 domain-containing protein, partial [Proteobacteria bacterium]|nr:DUF1565 domain-containing protein [Pseudomonadota bacterium]
TDSGTGSDTDMETGDTGTSLVCDFETNPPDSIQAAIASSSSRDVICVGPGTYYERLSIQSEVQLVGLQGAASTIIDAGGNGSVLFVSSDSLIQGLTLTNGAAVSGSGVWIYNSSPLLTDMIISNNHATEYGGGVFIYSKYPPQLTNVTVSGNSAGIQGGGFYVYDTAAVLSGLTISGNSAAGQGGGLLLDGTDSTQLVDSVVSDNLADLGGGVFVSNSVATTMTRVVIAGNEANSNGGGVYFNENGAVLANVSVLGNTAGGDGGGVYVYEALPSMTNMTISGNTASNGGGIYVDNCPNLSLINLNLTHNSASGNGGGLYVLGAAPSTWHNNSWQNTPTDYSGMQPHVSDLFLDPQFISMSTAMPWSTLDLHLHRDTSNLANGGDASLVNADGTTSDIGAYGGPEADFDYYDDGDGDSLYDGWEDAFGLDTNKNSAANNNDADQWDNSAEFAAGTNPTKADTDGDASEDDVDGAPLDPTAQ